MNLTLTSAPRRSRASSRRSTVGLPQVNLLPPEVRAARGLVTSSAGWPSVAGVVLVVTGLVYGFALCSAPRREGARGHDTGDDRSLQSRPKVRRGPPVCWATSSSNT